MLIWVMVALLYSIALVTIILSAHCASCTTLLQTMTQENGWFESLTVILLFGISIDGTRSLIKYQFERWFAWAVGLFALLSFVAGMEEISWGQQLLHFHSGDYFLHANLQHETNLHNLINANLFSSMIYSTVYTLLVFLPLGVKLFPSITNRWRWLRYFDINPHAILIVLFASVFQIYFYEDFGVWMDMATHLVALGLFGLFLIRKKSTISLKLHYGLILLSTAISMGVHEIYRFENMQYEIREMFVVLAVWLIFREQIEKEKGNR